jgi:hypothetical protein
MEPKFDPPDKHLTHIRPESHSWFMFVRTTSRLYCSSAENDNLLCCFFQTCVFILSLSRVYSCGCRRATPRHACPSLPTSLPQTWINVVQPQTVLVFAGRQDDANARPRRVEDPIVFLSLAATSTARSGCRWITSHFQFVNLDFVKEDT